MQVFINDLFSASLYNYFFSMFSIDEFLMVFNLYVWPFEFYVQVTA